MRVPVWKRRAAFLSSRPPFAAPRTGHPSCRRQPTRASPARCLLSLLFFSSSVSLVSSRDNRTSPTDVACVAFWPPFFLHVFFRADRFGRVCRVSVFLRARASSTRPPPPFFLGLHPRCGPGPKRRLAASAFCVFPVFFLLWSAKNKPGRFRQRTIKRSEAREEERQSNKLDAFFSFFPGRSVCAVGMVGSAFRRRPHGDQRAKQERRGRRRRSAREQKAPGAIDKSARGKKHVHTRLWSLVSPFCLGAQRRTAQKNPRLSAHRAPTRGVRADGERGTPLRRRRRQTKTAGHGPARRDGRILDMPSLHASAPPRRPALRNGPGAGGP